MLKKLYNTASRIPISIKIIPMTANIAPFSSFYCDKPVPRAVYRETAIAYEIREVVVQACSPDGGCELVGIDDHRVRIMVRQQPITPAKNTTDGGTASITWRRQP